MNLLLISSLLALSIAWLNPVQASTESDLQKQRTLFKQASKALKTNKIAEYNALKKKLNDYPLEPYLEYLYLRHHLSQTDPRDIAAFLDANSDSFYGERLRNAWLKKLAQQKQWHLFLAKYQATSSSHLQCLNLQALNATGKTQQALQQSLVLWLVPKSQDSACDPIFKLANEQGLITDALRWQRIELALNSGQFGFASYLAKSVTESSTAQGIVERWRNIHKNPESLLKLLPASKASSDKANLTNDNPLTRQVIAHGIDRLARISTENAFKTWQRIAPAYQYSQDEKNIIQAKVARRAALSRKPEALEYYADIPNQEWRVRSAIWQQNWPAVKAAIMSLDTESKQTHRWRYWLARSEAALGNTVIANTLYQGLLNDRDYYSFLAADILGKPYSMNHNPIVIEQIALNNLKALPAIKRLKEFYHLNMKLEARREAYFTRNRLTNYQVQLLSTLTHEWGWHNQSIALLGNAKYWDALDIRFPVVYDTAMLKAGKRQGLDPSWLFAIARQESAFNPFARSHVGATGLMQLMPATAKSIAKIISKPLKSTSELTQPERNIELGSAYLKRVYDQHQHSPVLATASYNAGPHRVKRWLPESSLPADVWIENIPFNETRKYTMNVLSYAAIFDYQRKQEILPLSKRMPMVKPFAESSQ
jgi:soluble lytic murein transglycosylase